MRRMLALLAAVGLVASLGPASVVAAPTTQPNRFHGDLDMLDQGDGHVVGHVVADILDQTTTRPGSGTVDVTWAQGGRVLRSHGVLTTVWFGQQPDNLDVGALRWAGGNGTLCDTTTAGTSCGPFGVIFSEAVDPAFANSVGWSESGSSVCCGGAWYQVGRGAFALNYLGPASRVSVAIPAPSDAMSTSGSRTFTATVSGAANQSVYWSVKEPDGGSVTQGGVYTAPATPGIYIVTATSQADVRASTSIRVPVVIPVGHVPGYDVGVDYHAYGADYLATQFNFRYQDPAVRQTVRTQLQGMADRGATVISTRIWLVTEPTGEPLDAWSPTFPLSDQEKQNLRAYAQDVAAVRGAGGNRLRLDLCLLWLGAADYTRGSPTSGLGWTPLSATEFTRRVAVTTDKVLAAVAGVKRPDGVLVVDTIYLDGEVMVGAKANQEWFLTTQYPRFVDAVSQAGFRPSLYFNASDTAQDYLDPGYVDADYPMILNGHRSMYWVYRSLRFMADHGLPLPDRVDFSWYVPATADASSATLLARVLDDADATLPSLGLPKKYGIAETFYYPDPTQRRELGQAIAAQALANPRLQRVCFWTTPVGIGGTSGPAYPFAIEDFYPPPS